MRDALSHFHAPVVVKADGLAAGKGVVIAKSKEEAASVAAERMSGKMVGQRERRRVVLVGGVVDQALADELLHGAAGAPAAAA